MAQCGGKTRKGARCKREAKEGSAFCSIHVAQEIRARKERTAEWDADAILEVSLGLALVAALLLFRLRR